MACQASLPDAELLCALVPCTLPAAGKGVIVAQTLEEAYQAVDDMMVNNAFGEAGGCAWGRGRGGRSAFGGVVVCALWRS